MSATACISQPSPVFPRMEIKPDPDQSVTIDKSPIDKSIIDTSLTSDLGSDETSLSSPSSTSDSSSETNNQEKIENKNDQSIDQDDCETLIEDQTNNNGEINNSDYRQFYSQRVERLSRLRESCEQPASHETFKQLRTDMLALMEDDVQLMRQLLTLSDTLDTLRAGTTSSDISSSSDEEEDELDNGLLVGMVNQVVITDSPVAPRKQYFSRQNSVLRIPIPPKHRRNGSSQNGTLTRNAINQRILNQASQQQLLCGDVSERSELSVDSGYTQNSDRASSDSGDSNRDEEVFV